MFGCCRAPTERLLSSDYEDEQSQGGRDQTFACFPGQRIVGMTVAAFYGGVNYLDVGAAASHVTCSSVQLPADAGGLRPCR